MVKLLGHIFALFGHIYHFWAIGHQWSDWSHWGTFSCFCASISESTLDGVASALVRSSLGSGCHRFESLSSTLSINLLSCSSNDIVSSEIHSDRLQWHFSGKSIFYLVPFYPSALLRTKEKEQQLVRLSLRAHVGGPLMMLLRSWGWFQSLASSDI